MPAGSSSAPDAEPSEPSAAERRQVIRNSLSVGVAVGSYGVAFGAASVAAGFTPSQTSVSSLLTFTGGTQFAIAGVVAGGGTAAAALGSGYLLGARNTLYAVRLKSMLGVHGWRRALAAMLTIDESTAMALGQSHPRLARTAFWWTALSVYVMWNAATLLGAVGANALGDPAKFGLDAAVPAAFLALVAPRLRSGVAPRWVAGLGAVIAVVLIPLTPPGIPVIAACGALAITADIKVLRRLRGGR